MAELWHAAMLWDHGSYPAHGLSMVGHSAKLLLMGSWLLSLWLTDGSLGLSEKEVQHCLALIPDAGAPCLFPSL